MLHCGIDPNTNYRQQDIKKHVDLISVEVLSSATNQHTVHYIADPDQVF